MGVSGGNDIVWKVGSDVDDFSMGIAAMKSGLTDFAAVTSKDFSSGLVRELVKIEAQAKVMSGEMTAAQVAAQRFAQQGASPEMVQRFQAVSEEIERIRLAQQTAAEEKIAAERAAKDAAIQAINEERNAREAAAQLQIAMQKELEEVTARAVAEERMVREASMQAQRAMERELADAELAAIAEVKAARAAEAQDAKERDEKRQQANRIHNEQEQAKINAWHADQAKQEDARQQANRIHNEREQAKIDAYNERKKKALAEQAKLEQSAEQVRLSTLSTRQKLEAELTRLQDLRNRGLITENQLAIASANARQAAANAAARSSGGGGIMGNLPMFSQAVAVGLQDVSTVRSMGANIAQQVNAGANNAIFAMGMLNPALGTITALGIAGYQLSQSWSGAAESAKKMKEEAEASKKAVEGLVSSFLGGMSQAAGVKTQQEAQKAIDAIDAKREGLQVELKEAQNLVPRNAGDKEIRDKAIKEREQALKELAIQRAALNKRMSTLDSGQGTGPDAKAVTDKTKEMQDEIRILRGQATKESLEREQILMNPAIDTRQRRDYFAASEQLKVERLKNEAIKTGIDYIVQSGQAYAKTAGQMAQDGKAIKESLRTPEETMRARARELLKMQAAGTINENDMKSSLARMYAQLQGAPTLAQGLVRGTAEEVSARNKIEAENKQEKLIETMVDTITTMERYSQEVRDFTAEAASYQQDFWEDAQFVGVIDK